ncbi:MAG TPA: hypothetical protein VGB55_00705 [Tepidisphaeraceae bacterium]|jgi:hypothetical protein
MSVGLVPFYDLELPQNATYQGDGKGLAEELDFFDRIAVDSGFTPLSAFTSDALLEAESGDPQTDPNYPHYAIEDVLRTVQVLAEAIRGKPHLASALTEARYTLEELDELARSLTVAAAQGARVCLMFW